MAIGIQPTLIIIMHLYIYKYIDTEYSVKKDKLVTHIKSKHINI